MADDPESFKFTQRVGFCIPDKGALKRFASSLARTAVLATLTFAGGARAAPADNSIEVDAVKPGKSAVIVRLVNTKTNTLISGASITGSVTMGVTPTETFQVKTTARELNHEGRYAVGNEPGMVITHLELDAQVPGQAALTHGALEIPAR